jgi:hypothetical protein
MSGGAAAETAGTLKRWVRTSAFRRLIHYIAALLVYYAADRHAGDISALLPAGTPLCRYSLFHGLVFGGWVAVLTYRNLSWLRSRNDAIPAHIHPLAFLILMFVAPIAFPPAAFLFYPAAFLVGWRITDQVEREADENDRPAEPSPPPEEITIPDNFPGDK